MASTSYSSLLSMMSRGGSGKEGPCASVDRQGERSEAWKMSCIFQAHGSFS